MSVCYLNGKKHEINKQFILDYIDTWSHKFTDDEKEKIVNEVCFRMDSLELNEYDFQEWNCVEDAYTDAACCYIFTHNNSVQALLDEENDEKIFNYIGMGKPEPEIE